MYDNQWTDRNKEVLLKADIVYAYAQCFASLAIATYIVIALVLKYRYTCFQWCSLVALLSCSVLLSLNFFDFSNLCNYRDPDDPSEEGCFLKGHIMKGSASLILHFTSIAAVYLVFTKTNEIYHFAKHECLPRKSAVRRNCILFYTIIVLGIIDSIIVVIMYVQYLYVKPSLEDMETSIKVEHSIKVVFLAFISFLCYGSQVLVRKTREITTPTSFTGGMARISSLVLALAILYTICFALSIISVVTFSKRSTLKLAGYIVNGIAYLATEILLFIVVVTLKFEFKLQTRVTEQQ